MDLNDNLFKKANEYEFILNKNQSYDIKLNIWK